MVDISILTMVYKPTYNWGAPPCYNVGKTIINHPPVITMFIGGINFINLNHSQMADIT